MSATDYMIDRFIPQGTLQKGRLALAIGALLGAGPVAPTASAQAAEPMVYTVGLVTEANSQKWAYLHWRSTAFDLLEPRAWSVWRKDGLPGDPGDFSLDAVVQVQTSPAALSVLLERAATVLGEDTAKTRTALVELFEELEIGDGSLSDAELAAAVLQGVAAVPELLDSLQFVMRTFPSMAMALGTAHATPIPPAGPVTFEIRSRANPTAADEAVVGRVIVDGANPLILPAPTAPTQAPPEPGRPGMSDLSIPLRWATPPELARLGLAQHGFNVYRVQKAFAEANGWHTAAPETGDLAIFAEAGDGEVARVNSTPVLPGSTLRPADLAGADHTILFAVDHESRFPGYPDSHTPPVNGDQYYYFIAARDLLGRDGAASPGFLATFCDRMPPRVPVIRSVINDYQFDGTDPAQHLRVTWAANPPEGDKVTTAYALYRWSSTEELVTVAQAGDPAVNLVAILPQPASGTMVSYLDNGPGAPAVPADVTRTWWYTVRAIDGSDGAAACGTAPFGGNLSGHSPPRAGVLRDRAGPSAPEGFILIRCAEPNLAATIMKPQSYIAEGPFSQNNSYVDILVERANLDPNLAWIDLSWGIGSTEVPLGRFEFPEDELQFRQRLTFIGSIAGASIWIKARAGTHGGNETETGQVAVQIPQPGGTNLVAVGVFASVTYPAASIDPKNPRAPCTAHFPTPDGVEDPLNNGITIQFFPPVDMRQYKIFQRIEEGPLTLVKEASGTFDPATPVSELLEALPIYAKEICFFVQAFDQHGNPSPLVQLGCTGINFKFPIPKPILSPVIPGGTESAPTARIQWFSPRWGIERFEILIRSLPPVPTGLSPELIYNGTFTGPNILSPAVYRRYLTPELESGFGSGSFFEIEVPIDGGADWRVFVRGITHSGALSKGSNRVDFAWSPPDVYVGPNVPWPFRKLPKATPATGFDPRIEALRAPGGGGMVRIGEFSGRFTDMGDHWGVSTDTGNPTDLLYTRVGSGSPRTLLPFLLYRTQVPGGEWQQVPGDVYQVSPLMELIHSVPDANGMKIYDPFILPAEPDTGFPATASNPATINVIDTQPAISRATYRYFIVLIDPVTGEIEEILETNDVVL